MKDEFIVYGHPEPYVRTTQKQMRAVGAGAVKKPSLLRYWAWKTTVGMTANAIYTDGPFLLPVLVSMKFYTRTRPPGDLDNYGKGILDALNGIAYADDSQVIWIAQSFSRMKMDQNEEQVKVFITETREDTQWYLTPTSLKRLRAASAASTATP